MKDGRITQSGKHNDILESGSDFMELVGAHREALSMLDSVEGGGSSVTSHDSDGTVGEISMKLGKVDSQNDKAGNVLQENTQLVQEEEKEKGKVGFQVYWRYITMAYGGALVPLILLAQILFQLLQIAINYWMAWATPLSKNVSPPVKGTTLIVVYVSLALGSSLCILCRVMLHATSGYKTATLLFTKMHLSLFRDPMSFFYATPSGRILNRASTDQGAVDLNIQYQVGAFAFAIIQLLGIIAVMSLVA